MWPPVWRWADLYIHQWFRLAAGFAGAGTDPYLHLLCRTNVKIAASYAGISDFKDGATHYSITDLANLRALPGMTVIVPADAAEAAAWVPLVAEFDGPVYLRISRAGTCRCIRSGQNWKLAKG